jgi:hypothetical protein
MLVAKSILGDKIDHDESNKTINVCVFSIVLKFMFIFEICNGSISFSIYLFLSSYPV